MLNLNPNFKRRQEKLDKILLVVEDPKEVREEQERARSEYTKKITDKLKTDISDNELLSAILAELTTTPLDELRYLQNLGISFNKMVEKHARAILLERNRLGEILYNLTHKHQPELGGEITGILLKLTIPEIANLTQNPGELSAKIAETMMVIHHQAQHLSKPAEDRPVPPHETDQSAKFCLPTKFSSKASW